MKARKLNIIRLVAVAVTLIFIFGYQLVPKRVYQIIPSPEWREELFISHVPGEPSIGSWINQESYHFACEVLDTELWQHCGFNLFVGTDFVEGRDLSKFTHMKLKGRFKGQPPRVRIFFRNYNPAYSVPDDGNSAKYISLNLLTSEFASGEEIEIGLNEFVVADWWKDQHDLDRQLMPIEFSNITTMGFDFGPYLENAKDIELDIDSMYFEGRWIAAEHWYLGILVFWMVVTLAAVIYQLVSLARRARVYTKVITDLVTDKAQLEQESHKLQQLSNLDRLTGAFNRLGIEKNVERIFTGQRSRVIGLLLIDIDHFKRINDQRGHDVGDQVLKAVVEVIRNNIREHDILGRWGGEEFVLIAPNADQNIAYRIGEKLRELIAQYNFMMENPMRVTASFGVTAIAPNEDFEHALKRADVALYDAKSQGRNCTVMAKQEE